ncbi:MULTISPECIES: hypothetical protein [Enterobacteriaceae]|jgi:hypothetical protein|uniref:Holin n=2 Tax=Enterobacteriaceae TaxID=543 RepID=A0ABW1Q1N0_9ENTR|nr:MULTISPECIES: hypothetical protein [Phytobacter]MBS6738786.1 hypothetical protein [Enterobacteriaceae bacterium]MDU4152745.1 hypothetical protein [Enterobacteriaceae bacterium]MDU7199059.1 hypothetical protein [Enterobacteriaceae bacterium]MDU7377510.1 hypothetical protein [Enterobacteriaceae bacterium]MDV2874076.1 hypothetical protein [Phytobacter diazotrophicus]
MKMNDQPGNIVTQFFAWLGVIASGLGLSTQDVVYMLFGLIGVAISVASFCYGRLDARRKRKEDEKRTEMISHYLSDIQDKPHVERPAAMQVAVDALERVGE